MHRLRSSRYRPGWLAGWLAAAVTSARSNCYYYFFPRLPFWPTHLQPYTCKFICKPWLAEANRQTISSCCDTVAAHNHNVFVTMKFHGIQTTERARAPVKNEQKIKKKNYKCNLQTTNRAHRRHTTSDMRTSERRVSSAMEILHESRWNRWKWKAKKVEKKKTEKKRFNNKLHVILHLSGGGDYLCAYELTVTVVVFCVSAFSTFIHFVLCRFRLCNVFKTNREKKMFFFCCTV